MELVWQTNAWEDYLYWQQTASPRRHRGLYAYLVSAAGRAGGVNPFSFNSLLISVIALSN